MERMELANCSMEVGVVELQLVAAQGKWMSMVMDSFECYLKRVEES